jgi:hypothetical protein
MAMSALRPKADIARRELDVRFVPITDVAASLDHLVGGNKKTLRYRDAQRFGGF